jgi:hypothetical protein
MHTIAGHRGFVESEFTLGSIDKMVALVKETVLDVSM